MILNASYPLTPNFTVGEFQKVSKRALTDADLPRLEQWADTLLQPIREQWGCVYLTSYIRPADRGRAHENGGAIDFVTRANLVDVFLWIARSHLPFGRVIFERSHIHLTLPGPESWAGDGLVYTEPQEGEYVQLYSPTMPAIDSEAKPIDDMFPWSILLLLALVGLTVVFMLRNRGLRIVHE